MARVEARLRRKAAVASRADRTLLMIPLTLFLLACGAIYLGTIQAAFNALMRVSLRLLAEGSGRAPDLERYLQEPLLLFLPLRTLLGLIEGFVVLLLALMIGISGAGSFLLLASSMVAFGAVCEFLLPFLIVSRDPERVLELLLPILSHHQPAAEAADLRAAAPAESFAQRAHGAGIGEPRRSERRRGSHQRNPVRRAWRVGRAG